MNESIKILYCSALITILLFSCSEKKIPKAEPSVDNSLVEVKVGNTVILQQEDEPCNILPTSSTVFGNADRNLVQPSVYMKLGDLSPFNFKFYFEDMDFVSNPSRSRYESLKERIFTSLDAFNQPPYKNNFIIYIDYGGQRYSNSWDPETQGSLDGTYTFIRDRTGLVFNPISVEDVWFDCPEKPNWKGFNVIEMEAEFDGPVVSMDFQDTLNISGELELIITARTL